MFNLDGKRGVDQDLNHSFFVQLTVLYNRQKIKGQIYESYNGHNELHKSKIKSQRMNNFFLSVLGKSIQWEEDKIYNSM